MDRPSRLPVDCPRCERCGAIALDDDRTIACPLCNNWCTLCLDGVPTFVSITRPYRGSLIAGMRPTAEGEALFEGYACDYHKATLRSYSYIAPPMIGRYEAGQAYLEAQRHAFVVCDAYGRLRPGRSLKARPGGQSPPIDTRPMAPGFCPVQHSLPHGWYADDETFTISVRADKAIRIERSRAFWYNSSLPRMAGRARARRDALFGQAVRGGRGGERELADKGVAVILSDRAAAAGVT